MRRVVSGKKMGRRGVEEGGEVLSREEMGRVCL